MAAFDRPTEATYAINESITVDTTGLLLLYSFFLFKKNTHACLIYILSEVFEFIHTCLLLPTLWLVFKLQIMQIEKIIHFGTILPTIYFFISIILNCVHHDN